MQNKKVAWVSYSLKQYNNPLSHLGFADDDIIFTKASPIGMQGVKKSNLLVLSSLMAKCESWEV